jgi:hypothetical protein
VKPLGEEDVGRDSGLHGEFKNTTAEAVEVSLRDGCRERLGCGGETERQLACGECS